MRILHIYIFLIILLTICSCSNQSASEQNSIARAESLINNHSDSVLAILDSIDIEQLGPQKAYAYYLKGKAKLDLHNYPEAMDAFLHAEKCAEQTGNDSVLALSRVGMMNLYDSICDINEKGHYAVKACEVYEKYHDYDNMYAILSGFTNYHAPEDRPAIHADKIKHYASILNDNDTTRCYFYADTLERRSERLYRQLENFNSPDVTSWLMIDGLKGFNPYNLSEKIKNDDGWREDISSDSANISAKNAHLVAWLLWEQGLDENANDFITYYREEYREPIINQTFDTINKRLIPYVSFRLKDRRRKEFRSTFQEDVRAVVVRFNYEEVLMREQTIRFQRVVIILISALAIAVMSAIAIYIRTATIRRRRRQEQDMLTASELRTALHDLEELHLNTLSHLCDTYYENYANESVKSKAARDTLRAISELASSDDFVTRLEKHLDDTADGLMSCLRAEMPDLKESDTRLFLYNALGLSIPSMCLMLGERREVIYNRRLRLRARIREVAPTHMEIFLNYLR